MRNEMLHVSNLVLSALTALVLMAGVAAESRAQTPPGPDRDAIEAIVRDYLLENPEIIEEAIALLRTKRHAEERARAQAAIRENGEALRAHPMSPVSGNADGDVTLVEFFDYQCGYCKRALGTMEALLETDADVRVVWKEFPILGPVSSITARAASANETPPPRTSPRSRTRPRTASGHSPSETEPDSVPCPAPKLFTYLELYGPDWLTG